MDLEINIKDFEKQRFFVTKYADNFKDFDDARTQLITAKEKFHNNDKNEYMISFNKSNKLKKIIAETMVPEKYHYEYKENIRIIKTRNHKTVSATFKGNTHDLRSAHIILREYFHSNNLELAHYPIEFYLNNPLKNPEKEWEFEIQMPVIDFKPEPDLKLEKIKLKEVGFRKIAAIQHKGHVLEKNMVKNKLKKWIDDNNIEHEEYFLKFITHPDAVIPSDNIFEVGVFIKPDQKIKEVKNSEVKIFDIPRHMDVVGVYKGPYKNLNSAHRLMRIYTYENDLENTSLPIEVYLNDPFEVKSENLLTEIRLPVTKFKRNKDIKPTSNITVKKIEKQERVFIRNYGDMIEIEKVRQELNRLVEKNNLKVSKPHFVRYFIHPLSIFSQKMFFDVGYIVNEYIDNITRIIEFPKHGILYTTYKGHYNNLKEVCNVLRDYGDEKGLELSDSHREKYFNTKVNTKEENLLTELQIPINIS